MKRFRQLGLLRVFIAVGCVFCMALSAETFKAISPNSRLQLTVDLSGELKYSVQYDNKVIINPSPIGLTLEDRDLGKEPKLVRTSTRSVNETIVPVVAEKRSQIPDVFNELTIQFEGDFGLIVRACDDGVAYRFLTRKEGKMKVVDERTNFCFPQDDSVYYPITRSMHTSIKSNYSYFPIGKITPEQLAFLPILEDRRDGIKVLITEADLRDYPGMFIAGAEGDEPVLRGTFAAYPLEETQERDRTLWVTNAPRFKNTFFRRQTHNRSQIRGRLGSPPDAAIRLG